MKTLLLLAVTACAAFAQEDFDWKSLDKLADKAKETSNITLDADAIRTAGSLFGRGAFLDSKLKDVKGVYIRTYEFAGPDQYDPSLVEPLMAYLRKPEWKKIVDVKEKKEKTMVCLKAAAGIDPGGFAIVSMEPNEVSIIFISGSLNLNDVGQLRTMLSYGDAGKKK
jgi:hypothetical protein